MKFEVKLDFGRKREKKSDLVQYEGGSYFLGLPSISPQRIRDYIEAYKISELVRSCVDKINLAAKGIPWYLYERVSNEEIREVESHPLVDILRHPSKGLSWPKFIERAVGFYLISGNRYIRKYVGSFRRYGELEVLASQKVQIKPDGQGGAAFYEHLRGSRWERIPAEEILHSRMFNPADDLYGLSPVTTIASQLDISKFATEWSIKFLQNDARPGAVAFVPGVLTEDQRTEIKNQWAKDFKGSENSGGLLIIETGSGAVRPGDLKLLSYPPKELELAGSEKIITRKVCGIFHVPPELLGDSENKTYSNQKEARKALYQEATLPHLDELRDDLNAWLVPMFGDAEKMFYNYDASDIDALSPDTNELWERFGRAVDRGILTRNQALEGYGYGRSDDPAMDIPTVQATVLPLDAVSGGGEE